MTHDRTRYSTTPVTIDGYVTVWGQWPTDHRWNGWLCPRLDPWAVETVMWALTHPEEYNPNNLRHEWDGDVLVVLEDADTEGVTFADLAVGDSIEWDGATVRVADIDPQGEGFRLFSLDDGKGAHYATSEAGTSPVRRVLTFSDRLTPDEDGLYDLGAYSWVWSESVEADLTAVCGVS